MRLLSIALAMGLFVSTAAFSDTTDNPDNKMANSMKDVQAIFKQVQDQSQTQTQSQGEILGLFDIDMVLIRTKIPAFQMNNMKEHKAVLKKILGPLTPLEKDLTLSLIAKEDPVLVDPETPRIIEEIKNKNTKLIALTSTLSGALPSVKDFTSYRVSQLDLVNIDFSTSFPKQPSIIFSNLPAYRQNFPEFKEGVLSANGENKGAALVAFLKKVNYKPDTIIFVDDREPNLTNVGEALSNFDKNINYIPVLFKGEENTLRIISEEHFEEAWMEKIKQAHEIANLEKN